MLMLSIQTSNSLAITPGLQIFLEKELDAAGICRAPFVAIGSIDRPIQRRVCGHQLCRHGCEVVELGKGAIRVHCPSVKNLLCCGLDDLLLFCSRFCWPWKVVVNDVLGVSVSALQSPANCAHPGVVSAARQHAKVIQGCVRNGHEQITRKNIRLQNPYGNESSFFGRHFGYNQVAAFRKELHMEASRCST